MENKDINESEKKRYKELYEKIKNKQITFDSLDCADIFVIGCMLDEENKVLRQEIEKLEKSNSEKAKELKEYKKKNLIV